ncbi:hypothetical protein KAR91_39185, partial [Candidatus Pacearchaeota archaeon]|nr:hypothetical protein [Candidatus Pacearchaeota archaeon]
MADKDDNRDVLKRIKDRFKESSEAFSDNHDKMVEDLEFIEGEGNQWPQQLKAEREMDGRPCLEINKIPTFMDQVMGDERQNRPRIKIRPVDSKADKKTAEILTGAIKNIENVSNADIAYDTAFDGAIGPGKGAFRINTEYADDDVFEQDIRIRRIKNAMTVYPDPNAQEWDYSDGRYMIITEMIPRDEFKAEYPDEDPCNFESGNDDKTWIADKTVRVAEYFEKEEVKKKLYLVKTPDGEMDVVEDLADVKGEHEVIKEREVKTKKITWYKVSGKGIIEGPTDWAGKYFPIVLVWGKELNIEGRSVYSGMIRRAKDPSRLYNYYRSLGAEAVALAPKAPFLVTATQIEGHENEWNLAHKKNYSYLLVNPDTKAPGWPQRQFPTQQQSGIQTEVMIADQEIHDTTGLQQASMGEKSNEKSGKAIDARRQMGDRGQYAYPDNLKRALQYAGKVLVDLIPKIWDTARFIRIEPESGDTELVQINKAFDKDGKSHLYDLTTGKYDCVISVGPSYATQRLEAADSMLKFAEAFPQSAPMIGDLIAGNMDWPGADEIAERLKKLLPPGIAKGPEGEEGAASPPPPGGPPSPPP